MVPENANSAILKTRHFVLAKMQQTACSSPADGSKSSWRAKPSIIWRGMGPLSG